MQDSKPIQFNYNIDNIYTIDNINNTNMYNINTNAVNYFNQPEDNKLNTNNKFDYHQLPKAYLCDNNKSNALRSQFIKNQTTVIESNISEIPNIFFSDENINIINNNLIYAVYKNTNNEYKIKPQSNEQLLIVMRYVFLEYARHLPYDIANQIRELNCIVIGQIIPNVITQITQRKEYLRVISAPREILPYPTSESTINRLLPSA
jgi:hypothetical protein